MLGLPSESVDLVVTSPPYDDLRDYGNHEWDFYGVAWNLARLLKPGGVIVWVVNDATIGGNETGTSMMQALHFQTLGLNLHDTMPWRKANPTPQDPKCHRYTPAWEYMFVLSKGKPSVCNYIMERSITAGQKSSGTSQRKADGESRTDIARRRTAQVTQEMKVKENIWTYAVSGGVNGHPAPYPESLAKDHISSWSDPGAIVLDPFAGSGTTLKAAKELNRRYIGIEVNPEYVKICEDRTAQESLPLF
jgi:site-specific DNA-methyltransferase (adenine-specific)